MKKRKRGACAPRLAYSLRPMRNAPINRPMIITAPKMVPIVPDCVARFVIPVKPEPVALNAVVMQLACPACANASVHDALFAVVNWVACTDARTAPPIDTDTTNTTNAMAI
jgi:hypothetical protein